MCSWRNVAPILAWIQAIPHRAHIPHCSGVAAFNRFSASYLNVRPPGNAVWLPAPSRTTPASSHRFPKPEPTSAAIRRRRTPSVHLPLQPSEHKIAKYPPNIIKACSTAQNRRRRAEIAPTTSRCHYLEFASLLDEGKPGVARRHVVRKACRGGIGKVARRRIRPRLTRRRGRRSQFPCPNREYGYLSVRNGFIRAVRRRRRASSRDAQFSDLLDIGEEGMASWHVGEVRRGRVRKTRWIRCRMIGIAVAAE